MALDSTKVNKSKKNKKDEFITVYSKKGDEMRILRSEFNADKHDLAAPIPGNLNKSELDLIADANPIKRGKKKSKANPGDAGESIVKLAKGGFPDLSGDGKVTQKDILMGKGVIKMKKGGIVKKKPSRTRIAKKGFGIAKRGY